MDVEDQGGRIWPMTYRCVPHRYSYELRAGWKPFAAFWNICVGDSVVLSRPGPDRSHLKVTVSFPQLPSVSLSFPPKSSFPGFLWDHPKAFLPSALHTILYNACCPGESAQKMIFYFIVSVVSDPGRNLGNMCGKDRFLPAALTA